METTHPQHDDLESPVQQQETTQDAVRAVVQGQALHALPQDLYIPPDALEVFLESFEGPLDLLLYLIRKQNLDILDIPIAEITRQYMEYVELMRTTRLDLAAEYLLMAAMLAEIKSRMLLPREAEQTEDEDPRAALVRRLQEYERFREAAYELDQLPRLERDLFVANASYVDPDNSLPLPQVSLDELASAFQRAMDDATRYQHLSVTRELLSVRERMTRILRRLDSVEFLRFEELFEPAEGRMGLVVTFIALLEMFKDSLIAVVQSEPFAPIHVKQAA